MIELGKHIESLLLENDCVIIPGLGGLVAHYSSSVRNEEEGSFLPPTRTLGFNPQLKLNDGLLVQSYMESYGLSFPEATKMVEGVVDEVISALHTDGYVCLPNIGEIRYNIYGDYNFVAFDNKFVTPSFYGLDTFNFKTLSEIREQQILTKVAPAVACKPSEEKEISIPVSYLRNAVASVAAVILFFLLSTPLENTNVQDKNYAQLFPMDIIEELGKHSMTMTPLREESTKVILDEENTEENSIDPNLRINEQPAKMAVKGIKITSAAEETQPVVANVICAGKSLVSPLRYHIIVAGGITAKEAHRIAENLYGKGFTGAKVLQKNGKIRVGIYSFDNYKDAELKLMEVRKQKEFSQAWLLNQKL